ncbi:MAG: hypothetical protein ACI4MV_03280 [Christensenellales bacterium]
MYYFDEKLCKTAVELLQNSKDLSDIANDVHKINRVLNYSTLISLQDMRNLDIEIKDKYLEIQVFKMLADKVNWIVSSNGYCQQNTVIEVEELKFDRFYLYALALKKSGKIAKYIDFFDKKRIEH